MAKQKVIKIDENRLCVCASCVQEFCIDTVEPMAEKNANKLVLFEHTSNDKYVERTSKRPRRNGKAVGKKHGACSLC